MPVNFKEKKNVFSSKMKHVPRIKLNSMFFHSSFLVT